MSLSVPDPEFIRDIDNLEYFVDLNGDSQDRPLEDELACECNCILLSELMNELQNEDNWEALVKKTGFGSGCGKCLREKEHWQSKVERFLK